MVSLAKKKKTLSLKKKKTVHFTSNTLHTFPNSSPFLLLSHWVVFNSCDPWTTARLAPLFMGFPRQDYWSGLPFPTPGNLPNPGIKLGLLHWQAGSLPLEPLGKPYSTVVKSLPVSAGDARDLGLIPGSG